MRVEKQGDDYDFYLTPEEIDQHGVRKGKDLLGKPTYEPLWARVAGAFEVAELVCTRDATTLSDPKAHNDIYFEKMRHAVLVKVYPPVLAEVMQRGFAMTRYDGYESKVWIRRDDHAGILQQNQPETLNP